MFVLPWKLMEDMPSKQVHLHNNSMSNLMTKLFPYSSTDLTPSPRYYLHKREKVTFLRNMSASWHYVDQLHFQCSTNCVYFVLCRALQLSDDHLHYWNTFLGV